jgi:hypothetical protein
MTGQGILRDLHGKLREAIGGAIREDHSVILNGAYNRTVDRNKDFDGLKR